MIDAFKAWAEQFAKRLDELGACPRVTGARVTCSKPKLGKPRKGDRR